MFSINTNVASLEAQNYLTQTSAFQQQTIEEVTSGLRIVNSGNDAAGLAVANGFASDEAVLTQGIANANDGIGQLQTVDGGENNISQLLDRASTLATQSASGTFTGNRATLNNEFQSVLTEINREAQAIGLNQGGTLAQNLALFIGGGQGTTGASAVANGEEQLNLSTATVDAKSLGLVGVQVVGGTVGTTDIGTGSATSVQNILSNTANTATETQAGYTTFYVNGPGFSSTSGNTQVKLSVNLTGVTDTDTLVNAINAAITATGLAGNQQATAFANANITASANTDSTGKTQLVFSSSDSAFQVTGGDQVANALLGNFSSGSTGNTANPTVVGATAVQTTASAAAPSVTLTFQGAGLSSTQTATLAITSGETQAAMLAGVQSAIAANTTLAATGITASLNGSGKLVFTGPASQTFTVQATGDTNNNLGLGSYGVAGTSVTGAAGVTSSASQALQISVNGGASVNLGTLANGGSAAAAAAAINTAIQSSSDAATLREAGITATTSTIGSGTAATLAVGGSNGVTFTAAPGAAGNNTTVTFVNPGSTASLGVTVSGTNITVNLGYASGAVTSTAQDVINAIAANSQASALVTATATGTASTVQAAAVSANLTGGTDPTAVVKLTSGTGASFAVNAEGASNAFGFNASTSSTGVATALASLQSGYAAGAASEVQTQGENQSNTSTGNNAFTFTALTNANDAQTVTLSAVDSAGNSHSINVGLTSSNAGTLDQALATINSALQTSNDTTLQSLVAFKQQTGTNTTEGIQFASSAATFTASLGSTANGVGLSDDNNGNQVQGATDLLASSIFGTAGTANISNATSAAAAVTALTNAVTILGNAQSVIGRGENQFQYAANLAGSQLTSDQAAESQIRDANIAQESANLTKASIQLQAGVAALAQANSAPQQLLSLLQGH
jgi:flagellin